MYSVGQMAKKLGVHASTLRKWDKNGKLVANRKESGHRYYTHDQYLKASVVEDAAEDWANSVVLITGSGTLATCALKFLIPICKKVIIYSRDEHKHRLLREKFQGANNVRYIIGDVKDMHQLLSSLRNVDICIHTGALKMIETGLYSAAETVRVNTLGSMNVAEACIERDVRKALFISSDKACTPLNGLTYGLSKALAESVWLSYNNYSTRNGTIFFATRYGNVINSNNSFYDILNNQKKNGTIKITDPNMTRFYFTIEEAMKLNMFAIENALGGEIFIPKLKSASVMTFINAFASGYPTTTIGLRGTEKLAEELISSYEMPYTYHCVSKDGDEYYKIVPSYISTPGAGWDLERPKEIALVEPFKYTSDSKDVERLTEEDLKRMVGKE